MKKHWISVKRGLSEDPKHRQNMGEAVWLFLHVLDAADWETGIVHDWKDKEIAAEMSLNERTVRDWRNRLQSFGYIESKQRQHSLDIIIHNWTNPRDYGGTKLNAKQSDARMSPSDKDDFQGDTQGDTEGDTQGLQDSIGNSTPFIESKPESNPIIVKNPELHFTIWERVKQTFETDPNFPLQTKARIRNTQGIRIDDGCLVVVSAQKDCDWLNSQLKRTAERMLPGIYADVDAVEFVTA
jgi:hypothetical protein